MMCAISRARRDKRAERFWAYALNAARIQTHNGMSDEEYATNEVGEPILWILALPFRHEYWSYFWQAIDRTRSVEAAIFKGSSGKEKRRVGRESERTPPKGQHPSYFKESFLEDLDELELEDLDLLQVDIALMPFDFNGFSWPAYA